MGKPRRVKTPHPAKKQSVRACSSCGNRHRPPTGKKCTHDGASTAASDEAVLHQRDLIETDLSGDISPLRGDTSSPVLEHNKTEVSKLDKLLSLVNNISSVQKRMDSRLQRVEDRSWSDDDHRSPSSINHQVISNSGAKPVNKPVSRTLYNRPPILVSPGLDGINEQFSDEQNNSRGTTPRITDMSRSRNNNNTRHSASHVLGTASSKVQHTSRGINSNGNTVGSHAGQSSANNSCSNNTRRGYRPPTGSDEQLLKNVMQPLQGECNMHNDYGYNDVPYTMSQFHKPNGSRHVQFRDGAAVDGDYSRMHTRRNDYNPHPRGLSPPPYIRF